MQGLTNKIDDQENIIMILTRRTEELSNKIRSLDKEASKVKNLSEKLDLAQKLLEVNIILTSKF